MILSDRQIRHLCVYAPNMVKPYNPKKTRVGILSKGQGSFGYDICLGGSILTYKSSTRILDPANGICDPQVDLLYLDELGGFVIRPGKFVLGTTFEKFRMPDNVCGVVRDKSTLARLGLAVQNTILEPGWFGELTLEISNHGPNNILLVTGMPIAQVQFFRGEGPKEIYDGRYNDQLGPTLPIAQEK